MRKKIAHNTFRKSKTSGHLYHFLDHTALPTVNEIFKICACFGITLFSALQSHLKEALISDVSTVHT